MAVRGEEVASSIDAHVREAVERMVSEIRTSIEDIRTAVDSQLKAALQSVQADVNSFSFLPHIQKTIGELEETFQAEQPAPVAASTGGGDVSRLKRTVQAVERGKSQVDILNALLEQSLDFGSRAALLILRGETFSGWKGVGFAAHGGNDENIKRFNAAPGLIAELDQVLHNERVVAWDGANLASRFGVGAPEKALLVPMVIKDKVAAAVYVDATTDDVSKLDQASVELLVFTTGLLIDTLAIRKKSPSPSLSEQEGAAPAAQAPAAAPAPAPAPKPAAPPPAPPAAEQGSATVAITAQQMREMMAAVAPAPARPAAAPPPPPPPPPPPVAPAPAPPAAPPATPSFVDEGRPTTQFIPPSGVTGRAAAMAAQSEDAKKHDEARRFARLLVSEIKLYNEAKVEVGRKNKDLYERLKEDIDRSRQMYDERIGEDVRKSSNYFYDELVRILADGDAEALGL